ncbi:MAG: JAB domain-containing protein [Sphaerochaeta associata]|uniref:JAB domain-containing protein n=1 Tax=Sphaerochaeta associata TaxID=1129264 RepID=UPI002B2135FA|nr:JAB domain-containing protein [Sphaerochaeta associata]MEA5107108.1 JAB domain-containing protein [Sphaerochaeta associata]
MVQYEVYEKFMKYSKKQLIEMLAKEKATQVTSPADVYLPIMDKLDKLRFKEQEHFFVITLDGAHQIINIHITSMGLVNRTLVHPREIFRKAIADNSSAVIIGHNHPSGSLEPSIQDQDITQRLKKAGDIIGIKVIDHIIISSTKGIFSMQEAHML